MGTTALLPSLAAVGRYCDILFSTNISSSRIMSRILIFSLLVTMAVAGPLYYTGYLANVNPGASLGVVGYAPAALPGIIGAYAGSGRYVANSGGVVHVAKSPEEEGEAEPEPEPEGSSD